MEAANFKIYKNYEVTYLSELFRLYRFSTVLKYSKFLLLFNYVKKKFNGLKWWALYFLVLIKRTRACIFLVDLFIKQTGKAF